MSQVTRSHIRPPQSTCIFAISVWCTSCKQGSKVSVQSNWDYSLYSQTAITEFNIVWSTTSRPQTNPKSIPNRSQIDPDSIPDRSQFDPESIANPRRIDSKLALNRLQIDAKSTTNRSWIVPELTLNGAPIDLGLIPNRNRETNWTLNLNQIRIDSESIPQIFGWNYVMV